MHCFGPTELFSLKLKNGRVVGRGLGQSDHVLEPSSKHGSVLVGPQLPRAIYPAANRIDVQPPSAEEGLS